jgi:hypothetical protein
MIYNYVNLTLLLLEVENYPNFKEVLISNLGQRVLLLLQYIINYKHANFKADTSTKICSFTLL